MFYRLPVICFLLLSAALPLHSQDPVNRAVGLGARVQVEPPGIELHWKPDTDNAPYRIFKRQANSIDWGAPIAELAATDSSYFDKAVTPGQRYEYAVVRHGFDLLRDTFCLDTGKVYQFRIQDQFGKGLCCVSWPGYYALSNIETGAVLHRGAEFENGETVALQLNGSQACVPVEIALFPDMFPHGTYWTLTEQSTGSVIGTSGIQGLPIAPRPVYGYLSTGIDVPAVHHPGGVLLLVTDTLARSLGAEIAQWQEDLESEGWEVFTQGIPPGMSVPEVKALIKEQVRLHPQIHHLKLLGHVAVPYSGDIYPDTHSEHKGAWAADVYYADLDGVWTDDQVNRATAFFEYNHNTPGDGRFDQSLLPSPVELATGRVDLSNMTWFDKNEVELTRAYLQKNHAFRSGQLNVLRRALIDDNFGSVFAAPASSAWRNFPTLVGRDSVKAADYFTTGQNGTWLWGYGCGSGSHVSAEGVGHTQDFARDSLGIVFSLLFGSQFGDWDNENNFLRAPLAQGLTLSNAWSGNPVWTLHSLAMGGTLGEAARQTQNANTTDYLPGPQLVHVALMGDPTLRIYPWSGNQLLQIQADSQGMVTLDWDALTVADLKGYYLYRKDSLSGTFQLLQSAPIQGTTYMDKVDSSGRYEYLLRASKIEKSPSGWFESLSYGKQGAVEVVIKPLSTSVASVPNTFALWPNPGNTGRYYARVPSGAYQVLDVNGKPVPVAFQWRNGVLEWSMPGTPGVYWLQGVAGGKFLPALKFLLLP